MIAPDAFYVEPPTIAPGVTIREYRRSRPVKRTLWRVARAYVRGHEVGQRTLHYGRWWLCDDKVTIEGLIDGQWIETAIYQARD